MSIEDRQFDLNPKAKNSPQSENLGIEQTRKKTLETLEGRLDQFLENPPKQPKKEIADYVEQNGILVPERFQGLKQALEYVKSGGEIIVRSEHPLEYNGASGLLTSYDVSQERIDKGRKYCDEHGQVIDWEKMRKDGSMNAEWDVENQIFGQLETSLQSDFEQNLKKLSEKYSKHYCDLLGLDFESFNGNVGYSYWKKVEGFNRSIVADSAIPNRYHIFTTNTGKPFFHNYLIVDNGNIVLNTPIEMTDEMRGALSDVIGFYEKIRGMEKFDPTHCPIVEFQTDKQKNNHFLQYHRTRQIEPATFTLDRDLEEDEFKAVYVRGATPPEGLVLNVAMYYPEYQIAEQEDGSFDFHYNFIFSEIMSRRRIANFENRSMQDLSISCIDAHLPKSRLFNSQIAISIPKDKIPDDLAHSVYEKTREINEPARIPIRVISDGRKAYVRFER